MKFSIFLSFLPFTLSLPHSPYNPLFYSDVSIPLDSYFPKIPLFLVQGPAVYIWKFSVSEITESGSSHRLTHYKDDFLAKLANTLSIDWIKHKKYSAFYWIGKKSGLVKRQLTARLVVRMMHDISIQIEGATLKYLFREEEGKETKTFQKFFNKRFLHRSKQTPRLYKVSGENGQSIMEVPLSMDQLNKTDVFVLDRIKNVQIWNMNPKLSNPHKIGKAIALANYIKNVERILQKLTIIKESGFPPQEIILQDLVKTSSFSQLPRDSSSSTRNEQLLLYEFFLLNKRVLSKEIYTRPITLDSFKNDKTYLMFDFRTFNIFVRTGSTAHQVQVEQVMAAAEIISWVTPNYKWKKVTIILNMDRLPTHFLLNFPDKNNILRYQLEE